MDIENNLKVNIGDHVNVKHLYRCGVPNSEGGYVWVQEISKGNSTVTVKYVVSNFIEEHIDMNRLFKSPINTITGVFKTRSSDVTQGGVYTPDPVTPNINTPTINKSSEKLQNVLHKT